MSENLLDDSAERLALSARAYHRVIKIARTIADLENSEEINSNHILEAIQYRPKVTVIGPEYFRRAEGRLDPECNRRMNA